MLGQIQESPTIERHIIRSLMISLILCDAHLYDTIPHEQGVDGRVLKQILYILEAGNIWKYLKH